MSIPEEQNLKVILDAKNNDETYVFEDEDLKTEKSFNIAYYYTRELRHTTDLSMVHKVSELIKDFERTLFLRVFELLSDGKYNDKLVDTVKCALPQVEAVLSKYDLGQCNLGVAIALIYYSVKDSGRYIEAFVDWIYKNEFTAVP